MDSKRNNLDDLIFLDFEEKLLRKQEKKLKKHYLKPNAKAFINKFIRSFRSK